MYKCPKCGGSNLLVSCEVTMHLNADGDLRADDSCADPDFHADSYTLCNDCETDGPSTSFWTEENDDV